MAEDWKSATPVAVLELLIDNKAYLEKSDGVLGKLGGVFNRVLHVLRKNSIANSLKNIQAHYDLGNDFYETFLDANKFYSCAYFENEKESLEKAQLNKIQRILDKAKVQSQHHVLEIGCGWGGFAIEAVKQTGCRVTGLTLSKEQLAYAKARVKQEGLEDKIELHLCDYRDVRGQFDRIVSIEMLEAVGHEYYDVFFKACNDLLKPEGLGVFQVITIPDKRYESYRRGCDFIQKHIFPGGHLPSLSALAKSMARASDFNLEAVENIGPHYAETLKRWREVFMQNTPRLLELGSDEKFIRKWEYYFLYCEAGFRKRHIHDLQFVMSRPGNQSLDEGVLKRESGHSSRKA